MAGIDLDSERVDWVSGQLDIFGQEARGCPDCFPVLSCEHVPVDVEAVG